MELTDRKAIGIDDYMRTNVPHIYAIGDVTAKLQLAHVAEAMGVVAAETIAGAETLAFGDYRMLPRATFCQPQVASFGLTEEQARDEGYDVKVAKFPFTANGKAHGLGGTRAASSSWSPTRSTANCSAGTSSGTTSPNCCPSSRWPRSGTSPSTSWPATCTPTRRCRKRCRSASTGWPAT